jgi:hypothetical protein
VTGIKYLGKSFMLARLAIWTTQAYASGAVLGYTNIAVQNLVDAREKLNYKYWTSVEMEVVDGY